MTDEEIVQVLRCCRLGNPCTSCPAAGLGKEVCFDEVHADAVAAIERLTTENADLRKELEWKRMVIALAQRKQAEAEAEMDAAILDLKIFAGCSACRHCCNYRRDHQESLLFKCCDCTKKKNCKCGSCSLGRSNWEWHGLPEAPEEVGKA